MEQLDITKLTVEQLKALSYDEMKKLDIARYNLQLLEQEIAKRQEIKPKAQKAIEKKE